MPALQKSQEEETDANSFLHVLWRRAGRAPRGGGAAAELTTEHKAPLGQEASANPEVLGDSLSSPGKQQNASPGGHPTSY